MLFLKHLAHSNEDTLVDSEKEEDMDTEMFVQDNEFETLSGCEVFHQKFKGRAGKEVFALFTQFPMDGVDVNKIDLLQKSTLFFQLEKKKGLNVNMAGLMFTEEESVNRWINRSTKDIRFKKPKMFEEVLALDNGHTYKCFHNLEIDVINAEIKALHYNAHLFYEKAEVKQKMMQVINNFAIARNYDLLRCGKLTNSITQKQSSYQLATDKGCEI